jgi:non-ribosomal peptide synthetase component F
MSGVSRPQASSEPAATLADLVEAQVARTPRAVAAVHEDEQIGYGELDERANRLAHHLQGLGVGADVPVAVCAQRSIALSVALLGILKAGGACLPLDPSHLTCTTDRDDISRGLMGRTVFRGPAGHRPTVRSSS